MVIRYVGVALIICLAIVSGDPVFAETCPNVVGDWDTTVKRVTYANDTEDYTYSDGSATYSIIDQNDCLFYGNVEFQNDSGTVSFPITGVITEKKKLIITWSDVTINVTLTGYDKNKGLYTKWKFIGYDLNLGSSDPGGAQSAVYGTTVRR
ncbi:MAG: hypothetical protein NG747_00715 [Candidatus Brocadia sp.]|nr:hypothetical protein [Candidatus Brocadia sp.]